MTSSSTEKEVHGFTVNVAASHGLTAWVTVGMVLSMLSGCVSFSSLYTSAAKAGPDILQPPDETE